jgi:hypothetical protein
MAAAEEAVVPSKIKTPDYDSNLFPETDHSLEGTKKSEVSAESCSTQEKWNNLCQKRLPYKE